LGAGSFSREMSSNLGGFQLVFERIRRTYKDRELFRFFMDEIRVGNCKEKDKTQ